MDKEHDTLDKFLIVLVVLYNLSLLLFSLLWLFTNLLDGLKAGFSNVSSLEVNENITFGLFFSGVLGGAFYCLRAVYQRLGQAYTPVDGVLPEPAKTFNIKVWTFWYLYRPLQGAVLALVLLSLLKSGLIFNDSLSEDNLNSFYTLVGIGFLAGFGSHELIHKIQELIQVLFAKSKVATTNSAAKVKENNGK